MNTSALKTFAPAVRKQLMEAVTRKLDFALTGQGSGNPVKITLQTDPNVQAKFWRVLVK